MQSTQKYVRTPARKLRLLADMVRHLKPEDALTYLRFTEKAAASPLYKAIKSAVGNAKANFGIPSANLVFKTLDVGVGPTYKRFRAVSRGQAHSIKKRTAHIRVVVEEAHGTKS